MQKVVFLSGLAKAGPQLSNSPPPTDLGNAPMKRGGPVPRGGPLVETIEEEETINTTTPSSTEGKIFNFFF
jgi:hypothetical protein